MQGQETRISRLHFKETLLYDEHDSCATRAFNIRLANESTSIMQYTCML